MTGIDGVTVTSKKQSHATKPHAFRPGLFDNLALDGSRTVFDKNGTHGVYKRPTDGTNGIQTMISDRK